MAKKNRNSEPIRLDETLGDLERIANKYRVHAIAPTVTSTAVELTLGPMIQSTFNAHAGRKGGQKPKKKEWAQFAAKKYAHLPVSEAWGKLPDRELDNPNFGGWVVWVDRESDTLQALNHRTGEATPPCAYHTWRTEYHAKARRSR